MVRTQPLRPSSYDTALFGLPYGWTGGLSLAAAGDMRNPGVRSGMLARLGVAANRLRLVHQVHSRRVLTAGETRSAITGAAVPTRRADGIAAADYDSVLLVTVADCLPIYLVGPGGAHALVHSGWRGTGIVSQALAVLTRRHGIAPGTLTALIGPGIGACCYHVDHGRYLLFRNQYGPQAVRTAAGRWFVDLRAANLALLRRGGVRDIRVIEECTYCSRRLHSARRAGGGQAFQLMAAVLGRMHGSRARTPRDGR